MSTGNTCAGITNQQDCNEQINSVWIPKDSKDLTKGTCVCCATDGSAYANTAATDPKDACLSCQSLSCGGGNGFCKGDTGNKTATCVQDQSKKTFSTDCSTSTVCGGNCSGACGIGEWFLFQKCINENKTEFKCQTSFTQYKSYVTYAVLLLFLALLIYLII